MENQEGKQNNVDEGTELIALRRKVVKEFASDIAEGKIFLSIDQTKWRQQDIELISTTSSRLIRDLAEYVSGSVAGEEFEFLEKQLFFSISVLRTYNAFKTNSDDSGIEADIRRLESKIDKIDSQIREILKPSVGRGELPLEVSRERPVQEQRPEHKKAPPILTPAKSEERFSSKSPDRGRKNVRTGGMTAVEEGNIFDDEGLF